MTWPIPTTNPMQNDVEEFHIAFGHPAPAFPVEEITPEVLDLLLKRADWLIEEAQELKAAAEAGDLIGVIDALVDSTYFSVGGFVVLGTPMDEFWKNVHLANMRKLGPDGKPVPHPTLPGKIGKPEDWVPPEAMHEDALKQLRIDMRLMRAAVSIAAAADDEPVGDQLSGLTPSEVETVLETAGEIRLQVRQGRQTWWARAVREKWEAARLAEGAL